MKFKIQEKSRKRECVNLTPCTIFAIKTMNYLVAKVNTFKVALKQGTGKRRMKIGMSFSTLSSYK